MAGVAKKQRATKRPRVDRENDQEKEKHERLMDEQMKITADLSKRSEALEICRNFLHCHKNKDSCRLVQPRFPRHQLEPATIATPANLTTLTSTTMTPTPDTNRTYHVSDTTAFDVVQWSTTDRQVCSEQYPTPSHTPENSLPSSWLAQGFGIPLNDVQKIHTEESNSLLVPHSLHHSSHQSQTPPLQPPQETTFHFNLQTEKSTIPFRPEVQGDQQVVNDSGTEWENIDISDVLTLFSEWQQQS